MAAKKQTTKQTASRQTGAKSGSRSGAKNSAQTRANNKAVLAAAEKQNAIVRSVALFALGLLFVVMLFVPGAAAWAAMRGFLFGVFGVSFYFLGVALLYVAVLVAQQEPWLAQSLKILLGMATISGLAILFSHFSMEGLTASGIVNAYYQNGVKNVFSGGLMGALLGGPLLALCGRPAANILVIILLLCVVMLLTGVTPAEIADFVGAGASSAKEHGLQARDSLKEGHEQRMIARQTQAEERAVQRAIAAQEREEAMAAAAAQNVQNAQNAQRAATQNTQGVPIATERDQFVEVDSFEDYPFMPQQMEETPLPTEEQPWMKRFARQIEHIDGQDAPQSETPTAAPRAPFDIDLGPSTSQVQQGGSEPIEPIEIGPGGTFGLEAVRGVASVPMPGTASSTPAPTPVAPTAPVEPDGFWQVPAPEPGVATTATSTVGTTTPSSTGVAASPSSANTTPKDGWISMSDAPVGEAVAIENLVAAAMDKPKMADAALAGTPTAQVPQVPSYQYPPIDLFEASTERKDLSAEAELKANAQKLVETLESFGVKTRVLDISRGPSVTRYELQPLAGVKISRITNLADDIALNLSVAGVRIEAPIPGKPAVGIEVPNRHSTSVAMRSVLESKNYIHTDSPLTFALGKDIAGVAQVADLCKMPHLLVAGSTGSGKSVCVNSVIMSFLFRASPEDLKMILIDPKVVELAEYNGIPHLLMPVVTEPRKAAGALGSAVAEMEKRYRMFADNNVRDIKTYNKLADDMDGMERLPYIAIVIDELADLMMVSGKEVEDYICRIAQKARAAGMHLIVATQRPSVDVITGLIKANIPSRISFAVSSQIDSRTILDAGGAEKLLGMGDMLFMPVGASKPIRIQGTYVKDEEISRVLTFLKKGGAAQYDEEMIAEMEKVAANQKGAAGAAAGGGKDAAADEGDPMLKQCAEVVIEAGQASTSLLQRRCKLGYARAARIMDEMEQLRIIGPYEGSKPRAVLVSRQQWLEMCMNEDTAEEG